jgi:hypothetical protein
LSKVAAKAAPAAAAMDDHGGTSAVATETKNPTPSVATNAPVSTVHYHGTDMESAVGTGIEELSVAASENTLAFAGMASHAASLQTMKWTIHSFVTVNFFPNIKFITKKEKLAYYPERTYTSSYCSLITIGCNLPPGLDHANWWETVAKRVVKRKLSQLWSDKINALKKAYYGKYHV